MGLAGSASGRGRCPRDLLAFSVTWDGKGCGHGVGGEAPGIGAQKCQRENVNKTRLPAQCLTDRSESPRPASTVSFR